MKNRTKVDLKNTTHSRSYRLGLWDKFSMCCSPHKGCNRRHKSTPERNWKEHRKNQYK